MFGLPSVLVRGCGLLLELVLVFVFSVRVSVRVKCLRDC